MSERKFLVHYVLDNTKASRSKVFIIEDIVDKNLLDDGEFIDIFKLELYLGKIQDVSCTVVGISEIPKIG